MPYREVDMKNSRSEMGPCNGNILKRDYLKPLVWMRILRMIESITG